MRGFVSHVSEASPAKGGGVGRPVPIETHSSFVPVTPSVSHRVSGCELAGYNKENDVG